VDCETSYNIVLHGEGEHTWMAVDKKAYGAVMNMAEQRGVNVHEKSSFHPSSQDLMQVINSYLN
jgi:hypothetical protein